MRQAIEIIGRVSLRGYKMRAVIRFVAMALSSFSSASATEIKDMLGQWTWQDFTIEVTECANKRVCAKVVAGPKNAGMEIFASDLTSKNGAWFGQIVNPATGAIYNSRMEFTGARTWRLDGCTPSKVCLSGEFVRAK